MREFLKVVSAFAVTMVFYFASVPLVNHLRAANELQVRSAFAARLQDMKMLLAALQEYRSARGGYPVFSAPDSSMIELKTLLNSQLAVRPVLGISESDENSRYVSYDGRSYGLLLRSNRNDKGQPFRCKVEVDAPRNTGWWGYPPKCPF